jgi:c-di-GMP-binding flagellar brake protein YcgR
MLITFPDLLTIPEWLESGGEVTVRHGSHFGQHSGQVRILRVAVGPPPSVVLERLTQVETEQRRHAYRVSACLPLSIRVKESARRELVGQEEIRARTRNVSASGILVETSLPVTVGDVVELNVAGVGQAAVMLQSRHLIAGRVVRVEALDSSARRSRGIAVELVPESDQSRIQWVQFALELQRNERA